MSEPRSLEPGDEIRLRLAPEDEWTEAVVVLASENGRSILISLDGLLKCGSGIARGKMPLFVHSETGTIESLFGDRYEVELFEPGDTEITITVRPQG